ncbi:XPG domain containing-domain-containing protein [Xylariales sp. AK1849]|nr:XPG domain containing-domain-containing protein [Xylariales sp. AK1849]
MGIRGLTCALRPYAVPTNLRDESVVIDGPALVHRVWESVMKDQPISSVILCQVSYKVLGQCVINWLDRLRSKNVHVRKIYFDGFLPPRKWEVRWERIITQSRSMKAMTSRCRTGVQPRKGDRLLIPSCPNLMSTLGGLSRHKSLRTLPKHPMMVPAVIEALRSSHEWESVVRVIPGEADAFCADDVRRNGGVVLTSDSDLLIEDLGHHGSVSFLGDIFEEGEMSTNAQKYSLRDIETQLRIKDHGGLPRLAFEFTKRATLEQALRYTRALSNVDAIPEAYQTFLDEHHAQEYISEDHPVVAQLSKLDPRISELVIQSLNIEVMKPEAASSRIRAPRGPEEISMFLPIMIDDHTKRSAWTMSETTRELAYGLAQQSPQHRRSKVIEYRTMETIIGGRETEVPSPDDVERWCEQLLTTLDKIEFNLKDSSLQWLGFAVYQDVGWSRLEGKSPLSAALISEALGMEGDVETYSWDAIHFTAQVQACFYSLRMLKQILEVLVTISPGSLPNSQQRLRSHLLGLPNIAEYPTPEEIHGLLSRFGKANGLTIITEAMGVPEISIATPTPAQLPNPRSTNRDKKEPKQQRGTSGEVNPRQPASRNPFDVLSHYADD